jgi:hypothetical protein
VLVGLQLFDFAQTNAGLFKLFPLSSLSMQCIVGFVCWLGCICVLKHPSLCFATCSNVVFAFSHHCLLSVFIGLLFFPLALLLPVLPFALVSVFASTFILALFLAFFCDSTPYSPQGRQTPSSPANFPTSSSEEENESACNVCSVSS